jgi:hypothetical protein
VSNTRTDQYGGSLENRLRFPTRVLERMREVWTDKPLFVRISASDRMEGPEKAPDETWLQWGVEQSDIWVSKMLSLGVIDLLDVRCVTVSLLYIPAYLRFPFSSSSLNPFFPCRSIHIRSPSSGGTWSKQVKIL